LELKWGMPLPIYILLLKSSDAYTCVKIIELKNLKEQHELLKLQPPSKANRTKLVELETQMQPLTQFLEEAKRQRAAIKQEVGTTYSSALVNLLILRQAEELP